MLHCRGTLMRLAIFTGIILTSCYTGLTPA
ncbi:DUF2147 domain-containing protein, partial [Pseudomonas sp. MPR-R1B]